MTPAQLDTARALVAWHGWAMQPGMRAVPSPPKAHGDAPMRIVSAVSGRKIYPGGIAEDEIDHDELHVHGVRWYLPDLTDPATVGCLAAIACAAWAPKIVYIRPNPSGRWYVVAPRDGGMGGGIAWMRGYDSPGEAWAALILAAPEAP